jgi:hypothetical protein
MCQSHREFGERELELALACGGRRAEIAVFSWVTKRHSVFVFGVEFIDQFFDEGDIVTLPIMQR